MDGGNFRPRTSSPTLKILCCMATLLAMPVLVYAYAKPPVHATGDLTITIPSAKTNLYDPGPVAVNGNMTLARARNPTTNAWSVTYPTVLLEFSTWQEVDGQDYYSVINSSNASMTFGDDTTTTGGFQGSMPVSYVVYTYPYYIRATALTTTNDRTDATQSIDVAVFKKPGSWTGFPIDTAFGSKA